MTWIQTHTGRALSFLVPDGSDISIDDIAVGLARCGRFARQTRHFYSVAQHSVLVAKIVHDLDPGNVSARLWALLHDAHEAYTGDLPTPLKEAIRYTLPSYVVDPILEIQTRLDCAICAALGVEIGEADRQLVKHADLVALSTEREQILGCAMDWERLLPPPHNIEILEIDMAAAQFLWRTDFDRTLDLYRQIRLPQVAAE